MSLPQVVNFGKVSVSTGYNSAAVSVALSAGEGARLPDTADGIFYLVWWNWSDYKDPAEDPYREIVKVATRVNDALTIVRGQRSTTAQNHNLTGRTYKMQLSWLKEDVDELVALIPLGPFNFSEAIDGVRTRFDLPYEPNGYLQVVINGIIQHEGVGKDFIRDGVHCDYITAPAADLAGKPHQYWLNKKL